MLKKMLWKMGTCSRLSERLIGDGRDSALARSFDVNTLNFFYCVQRALLQQSFIAQPQQELPFLRLFMAPMTATMTKPVTAMIAMIDDVFIGLEQLNNLARKLPRQ